MKQLAVSVLLCLLANFAQAKDVMKMAVTTSFHNSGLADVLLPEIAKDLDLEVQLLVVGTGQAIKLGRAGDVDAILVHSPTAEKIFVADGYGTHRRQIMYNQFLIIGPLHDPAGVAAASDLSDALLRLAGGKAPFISRGDDSGTHKRELALWASIGLKPDDFGDWYKAVGAGMGGALNTASGMDAYILSDLGSWLKFGNKGDLRNLFGGDPSLLNQYSYLPVSPEKHTHVQHNLAVQLEGWLASDRAKELINGYQIDRTPLFTFNAVP